MDEDTKKDTFPDTITVKRCGNDEIVDTIKMSELEFTFTGLPKFNDGQEIEYIISENAIDGFKITNPLYHHKPIVEPEPELPKSSSQDSFSYLMFDHSF